MSQIKRTISAFGTRDHYDQSHPTMEKGCRRCSVRTHGDIAKNLCRSHPPEPCFADPKTSISCGRKSRHNPGPNKCPCPVGKWLPVTLIRWYTTSALQRYTCSSRRACILFPGVMEIKTLVVSLVQKDAGTPSLVKLYLLLKVKRRRSRRQPHLTLTNCGAVGSSMNHRKAAVI